MRQHFKRSLWRLDLSSLKGGSFSQLIILFLKRYNNQIASKSWLIPVLLCPCLSSSTFPFPLDDSESLLSLGPFRSRLSIRCNTSSVDKLHVFDYKASSSSYFDQETSEDAFFFYTRGPDSSTQFCKSYKEPSGSYWFKVTKDTVEGKHQRRASCILCNVMVSPLGLRRSRGKLQSLNWFRCHRLFFLESARRDSRRKRENSQGRRHHQDGE